MTDALIPRESTPVVLAPGAFWFPALARDLGAEFKRAVESVARQAPFRHMKTPGGRDLSVAMTNCGAWGWVTDRRGYRYVDKDPDSGRPWPLMPDAFSEHVGSFADRAGYPGFVTDACLINVYAPGAKMAPHVDRDEKDFSQPIVSVSFGLPATFLWGGSARGEPRRRVPLDDGDVVVWGGPARLYYHGVAPLRPGRHPLWGERRINLTFRRAR